MGEIDRVTGETVRSARVAAARGAGADPGDPAAVQAPVPAEAVRGHRADQSDGLGSTAMPAVLGRPRRLENRSGERASAPPDRLAREAAASLRVVVPDLRVAGGLPAAARIAGARSARLANTRARPRGRGDPRRPGPTGDPGHPPGHAPPLRRRGRAAIDHRDAHPGRQPARQPAPSGRQHARLVPFPSSDPTRS